MKVQTGKKKKAGASKLKLSRTSHVIKLADCLSALMEHVQYWQLYQCHFSTNIKIGKVRDEDCNWSQVACLCRNVTHNPYVLICLPSYK